MARQGQADADAWPHHARAQHRHPSSCRRHAREMLRHIVIVLVPLGAINLLHVLRRLETARALDPNRPSLVVTALRHFRRVWRLGMRADAVINSAPVDEYHGTRCPSAVAGLPAPLRSQYWAPWRPPASRRRARADSPVRSW